MNLSFLGDALDHWKGSLFSLLTEARLISDLSIDLMATDIENWDPDDFESFSKMLRVSSSQVLRHNHHLDRERKLYFGELAAVRTVFLDPDTGIATSGVTEKSKYVYPHEMHELLKSHSSRVVSVYQHISRKKTRDRVHKIIEVVADTDIHFGCCTYESPAVAMLFFSNDINRTRCIQQFFQSILGRKANKRVIHHHQ